jgi:hypothetical protein
MGLTYGLKEDNLILWHKQTLSLSFGSLTLIFMLQFLTIHIENRPHPLNFSLGLVLLIQLNPTKLRCPIQKYNLGLSIAGGSHKTSISHSHIYQPFQHININTHKQLRGINIILSLAQDYIQTLYMILVTQKPSYFSTTSIWPNLHNLVISLALDTSFA